MLILNLPSEDSPLEERGIQPDARPYRAALYRTMNRRNRFCMVKIRCAVRVRGLCESHTVCGNSCDPRAYASRTMRCRSGKWWWLPDIGNHKIHCVPPLETFQSTVHADGFGWFLNLPSLLVTSRYSSCSRPVQVRTDLANPGIRSSKKPGEIYFYCFPQGFWPSSWSHRTAKFNLPDSGCIRRPA